MINLLQNLELGVWPKILCKSLKKFDMGDYDRVYQADVFWAYKNHMSKNLTSLSFMFSSSRK